MTTENLQARMIKASAKSSLRVSAMSLAIDSSKEDALTSELIERAKAIFDWLTEGMDEDYSMSDDENVVNMFTH